MRKTTGRHRPNFTISYGLRFETQNHIPNKVNFAPGVALSYGIGGGGKQPKTVLRAGYGIFYHRFTYDLLLNVNRYSLDQQGQVQTIQSNPNGTPPDSATEESPRAAHLLSHATWPERACQHRDWDRHRAPDQ